MTEASASRWALLASVRARLAAADVADPVQEARWILDRAGGESATGTSIRVGALSTELCARVESLTERRVGGEPLAYVLGETSFRWLTIQCDRRALIPRPETEGLVDLVLARQRTGCAVDIGTGTGCLALSLASEGQFSRVIAVDRSPAALELAARNRRLLGLPVDLVQGDLTGALASDSVDVLVSNPPYLSESEHEKLESDVRDWEPAMALVAGEDGMDAIRRLFYDGRRIVRPEGLLVLEVDSTRASVAAQIAADAGWADVMVLDDLFGLARYLLARRREES
ncbi:MAG: peptide chain release factor N(5)-glutamine methyltransferase [Gemmatimonadota bacterium]